MGGESNRNMASSSKATYAQLVKRPVGKQIHNIYRDHLKMFTSDGQYKEQGLLGRMYNGRLSGEPHVNLSVWSAPNLSRPTFDEATSKNNEYRKTQKGGTFGPSWSTHWFKVQFMVPRPDLFDHECLELHWDTGSEGLVWTEDGKPLQGLTGNGERTEWMIPKSYSDNHSTEHTIYIEMACNGMFGVPSNGDTIQPPDPNRYFTLREADIVSVNADARALFYDFWIIGDAAREFGDDTWEERQALQVCNEIVDVFTNQGGTRKSIREGRKIASRYIGEYGGSAKVYDNDKPVVIDGIGHCHIDTCWLWPWAETKRKIVRSWSNQCDLLDRYPEHRFCASSAQQYKWLEQLYPYAFDRVKSHVKKGTFHPIGGSWVEHDTNMPSGESLVRQFLYGQRYFESRFGQRCRTFWLPDTFGYSSQLPQLCRLAGMKRFFTQKLSWNNINSFPHTTFNWVSLDNSQVICHMAPAETYTAEAHFGDVSRSVTQHKSMDQDHSSLLVFGKGDGGGGPTFGHLEKLRRCRGISDTIGRLPRVKMGGSVDDFFDRLENKAATGEVEFTTWYGELYLELHRGTYTSQANNKKKNRKAEILLHDVEYLATLATIKGTKGYRYPKKEIDGMWESVLLCQFHDCLPGSAIEMCYDDSDKLYAEVFKTGEKAVECALAALGFESMFASKKPTVPINTLGWNRADSLSNQADPSRLQASQEDDGTWVLRSDDLEVVVSGGAVTSLYDLKERRQLVPPGAKANQPVIFDDKPLYWQAWDVEVYHLDSRKELTPAAPSRLTERTDERIALTTYFPIGDESSISTTILLTASTPSTPSILTTTAQVRWHETMKFLKVEFPTTLTSQTASYETQFGIVTRPTHYNTPWDMAKFEVCSHKWADLSESNYGLSILNDCKYGFATAGSTMRLSLLRAPKAPDAHADMGEHTFKWAMMPHRGPLGHETVRAGFEFNFPLRWAPCADAEGFMNLSRAFKFDAGSEKSLIVDTVKRAEDDEDVCPEDDVAMVAMRKKGRRVVLRVYESLGGRSRGFLRFGNVWVWRVWRCNLLEDVEGEALEVEEREGEKGFEIELRAFEVASFLVEI